MQRRLWTITADGSDLEQLDGSAPRVDSLWSSGGMIAGETGQRVLAVTKDGIDWRLVTPGMPDDGPTESP